MEYVKLKKSNDNINNKSFILVALKLKEEQTIAINDETDKFITQAVVDIFGKDTNNTSVLFIGNIDKYKNYNTSVFRFKKNGFEASPCYRNYCATVEQQEKTRMYVNVCQDASTSWNTVKSALGAPNIKAPCYGAIVEVEIKY